MRDVGLNDKKTQIQMLIFMILGTRQVINVIRFVQDNLDQSTLLIVKPKG